MNKKIMTFVIFGFALMFVSAGLVQNYFSSSVDLEVTNPISIIGDESSTLEDVVAGESVIGSILEILNDANFGINVLVSDDAIEGIEVTYFGEIELTEKTVDFSLDVWEIPVDADKIEVKYTMVGDEFIAEVTSGELEGYSLIYYKDNSDRFESPSKAILVSEVVGNLPYEDDKNNDEYDYCATGEYDTCHGAKIWYVPTDAINVDGNLDWSRASDFFYESELMQYNADGELVVYPTTSLSFTPEYDLGVALETGTYTIITDVSPLA